MLADCVSLKFANQPNSFSNEAADSPQFSFGTQWLQLWYKCQFWYKSRSPEMCQVLSSRSAEAGRMDPTNKASFPVEIFSSAPALNQNVVYHMASIILLDIKPRLSEPTTSRQSLSTTWHMHTIAGACVRNDFEEQWDPVLIAGLLLIAPKLTHQSQRTDLLDCLRRAGCVTGINFTPVVKELTLVWEA